MFNTTNFNSSFWTVTVWIILGDFLLTALNLVLTYVTKFRRIHTFVWYCSACVHWH